MLCADSDEVSVVNCIIPTGDLQCSANHCKSVQCYCHRNLTNPDCTATKCEEMRSKLTLNWSLYRDFRLIFNFIKLHKHKHDIVYKLSLHGFSAMHWLINYCSVYASPRSRIPEGDSCSVRYFGRPSARHGTLTLLRRCRRKLQLLNRALSNNNNTLLGERLCCRCFKWATT